MCPRVDGVNQFTIVPVIKLEIVRTERICDGVMLDTVQMVKRAVADNYNAQRF
jgi:hypothetical protein